MTHPKRPQKVGGKDRRQTAIRLLALVEYRPAEGAARFTLGPTVDERLLAQPEPLPAITW